MRQSLGLKFAVLALLIGGSLSYCSIRVDDDYHLALQGDWPEQCIRTTRLKWDDRHFHGWVCAAYERSLGDFILYAEVPEDQGGELVFWLEDQQGVQQGLTISSNHACDGVDPRPLHTFHIGDADDSHGERVGVRFNNAFWSTYLNQSVKYAQRTESINDCAKQPTPKPLVVTITSSANDLAVDIPLWIEPSGYSFYWQGLMSAP
ncbi:MAG: hypothetical protein CBC94_004045 [Gammaproteobacteria bacterium TMED134]|nr:MAG: hypothetical protein CBC94_004045 [Gammaproteobacteria bacterium TMED134]HBK19386.1 hypothetical protein [Gammaproteobacteria bacterium]|tara:strand:- start:7134 stop:7748 length:615 start_codon:yes stop_codon:yes gene_type:complete